MRRIEGFPGLVAAMAVALAACFVPPSGQQGAQQPGYGGQQAGYGAGQQAPSAVGQYTATLPDGQQMPLVLAADGTVRLGDEGGRWMQNGAQVVLLDSDGTQIYGVLAGDQLTFDFAGAQIPFVRTGGGVAAAGQGGYPASGGQAGYGGPGQGGLDGAEHGQAGYGGLGQAGGAPARPFEPEKTLRGRRVTPDGTALTVTVPKGWKHSWQEAQNGQRAYTLVAPGTEGRGAILLHQGALSADEQRAPIGTLLQRGLPELIGNTPVQTVLAPEEVTVNGRDAGRLIVNGPAPNGERLEFYLASVRVDGWAYAIVGMYDAKLSDRYRPGVDTVLASFEGRAPPENRQLAQQIVGCWYQYEGSSDSSGSTSSQRTMQIGADGTFSYRSSATVGVGGGGAISDSRDHGTWRAVGNTVYATGKDGQVSTYTVRRQGGMLYLNGGRYLPCR